MWVMGVNIDIYLRNAFKELDAFSLPEIGTFRKVHLSAALDEAKQLVYPPRIEIEFSPQVDTRLGFTRYLTQRIQMPQEEAERIVKDIYRDINKIIAEEGQFVLPEIGTIFRNADGKHDFIPDQKSREAFAGELFGLEPVALSSPPTVHEEFLSLDNEETNMTSTVSEQDEKLPKKGTGISALALLLAFLVVGTGAVFLWQNQYLKRSSLQDRQFLSVVASEGSEADKLLADNTEGDQFEDGDAQPKTNASSRLTENERQAIEANEDKTAIKNEGKLPEKEDISKGLIAQAEPQKSRSVEDGGGFGLPRGEENANNEEEDGKIETLDKTTARMAKPQSTFHLIAGSFANESSAKKFQTKLEKQGFKQVEIIAAPKLGKYRVSVFSSASSEDVKIFRKTLKSERGVEGWILEQK